MSNEMAVHETPGSVPAGANNLGHSGFIGISAPYAPPKPPAGAVDTGATRALYDHPARRLR
jgi:hypothetical protein